MKTRQGFLALALLLGSAACRTDIQSGLDEANDLLYRKQYAASERLYRKLLKRLEQSGDLDDEEDGQRQFVLDRLGKINALYLRDYAQAINDFQLLIRHYPKTDQAFAARATVADIYHHKLGDLQTAIDAYHKLVSEFAERSETRRAQLQIVSAYLQLKNYEQARTEAARVIERWPQSPEAAQARFQIANSYYVQGRYAEAVATYERLLEEKPEPQLAALVLFELGNCFQAQAAPERALAYYYACLQDHPDPMLVQQKIRRVRTRLMRARPLPEIELPPYLRERLMASRGSGGLKARGMDLGAVDAPVDHAAGIDESGAVVGKAKRRTEEGGPESKRPLTVTTPKPSAAPAP